MSRVVLYPNDSPLLLSDVKRDARGQVCEAWVNNGSWLFRRGSDACYAFQKFSREFGWGPELKLKSEWASPPYEEVQIPDHIKGDYNDIINWARGVR